MEIINYNEDNARALFEAAISGSTTILETLIRRDQLILHKISLTTFSETPLHISTLLGHVDFTIAILEKCPKMALEFNSSKQAPLHLAAAEGHTKIVRALLKVNKGVCFARDEDDRIPLHLAVIRGRVEVIRVLVNESPESILELLYGDTVLHLCVKYNHLEALRLLVEKAKDIDARLFEKQNDEDGNTLLHLAALLRQPKTVRYIVNELGDKTMQNTKNKAGLTPLESLDQQSQKDLKSYQIREILMESNIMQSHDHKEAKFRDSEPSKSPKIGWWKKIMRYMEHQRNWVEETRGTIMTVATLIAAMTFQSMTNPPGGLWQQDYTNGNGNPNCKNTLDCEAGTSVLASLYPINYRMFMIANTIAFGGSLVVIFLIIAGFPLQNKFMIWVLTVTMSTTVVSAGFTYIAAMYQVTPTSMLGHVVRSEVWWLSVMSVVIFMVSVFDGIRFVIWLIRKFKTWQNKFSNKKKSLSEKKLGENVKQQIGIVENDNV